MDIKTLRMVQKYANVIEAELPKEMRKYHIAGIDRQGGYGSTFSLEEALEIALNDTGDEEHFCDGMVIHNAATQQICIVYLGNVFVPAIETPDIAAGRWLEYLFRPSDTNSQSEGE